MLCIVNHYVNYYDLVGERIEGSKIMQIGNYRWGQLSMGVMTEYN